MADIEKGEKSAKSTSAAGSKIQNLNLPPSRTLNFFFSFNFLMSEFEHVGDEWGGREVVERMHKHVRHIMDEKRGEVTVVMDTTCSR